MRTFPWFILHIHSISCFCSFSRIHVTLITYFVPQTIRLILIFSDIMFEYKLQVRAFTLLAVGMTATVFLVNGITNAELFPTAIRNIASAHALTWGRIGGIVAPQIFYLVCFSYFEHI